MLVLLFSALLPSVAGRAAEGDINGTWEATFVTPAGAQAYTFQLQQTVDLLSGTVTSSFGTNRIQNGRISGDTFQFSENVSAGGGTIRMTYSGDMAGDELRIRRQIGEFEPLATVARRPGAVVGPDLSGRWRAEVATDAGTDSYTFILSENAGSIRGTVIALRGGVRTEATVDNGDRRGNSVTFSETLGEGEREIVVQYAGTLAGDTIQFKRTQPGQPIQEFSAGRLQVETPANEP